MDVENCGTRRAECYTEVYKAKDAGRDDSGVCRMGHRTQSVYVVDVDEAARGSRMQSESHKLRQHFQTHMRIHPAESLTYLNAISGVIVREHLLFKSPIELIFILKISHS